MMIGLIVKKYNYNKMIFMIIGIIAILAIIAIGVSLYRISIENGTKEEVTYNPVDEEPEYEEDASDEPGFVE